MLNSTSGRLNLTIIKTKQKAEITIEIKALREYIFMNFKHPKNIFENIRTKIKNNKTLSMIICLCK